jgi:hypothetical protein
MSDHDERHEPDCPDIPVQDEVPYRAQGGRVFTPLPPQDAQLKMAQAFQTAPPSSKLPPSVPARRQPQGTTISMEDIRQFTFDRGATDNPLDLDLSFTDKDLQFAMRFTAMRYNAISPKVIHVHPDRLPFGETMLNGVAYYLYIGKLQQLMRNDVDYSAGNMTIDINKRRIEFLSKLAPSFKEAFEKQARDEKVTINLHNGFADVGGSGCGWGSDYGY